MHNPYLLLVGSIVLIFTAYLRVKETPKFAVYTGFCAGIVFGVFIEGIIK